MSDSLGSGEASQVPKLVGLPTVKIQVPAYIRRIATEQECPAMFEKSPGVEKSLTSYEEASRAPPPPGLLEMSHLLRLAAIAVALVVLAILLVPAFR